MKTPEMGGQSPEKNQVQRIEGVGEYERRRWEELYPKIDIRKVLEKVKEIAEREFELHDPNEHPEWKGDVSFWGVKRIIMMIFDEDRESDSIFQHLPEELQEEVRKINVDEYLKK